VTLLRQAIEEAGFVIFRTMDDEGLVEMELAAKPKWCYHEAKLTRATRIKQTFKDLWRKRHLLIRPKVIHLLSHK
jgi:hypothetical protein